MGNQIKYFLIFCALLQFCSVEVCAHNNKIDSLLTLIKKDKEDTNKVNHLNKLSWEYKSVGTYDSALHYANQCLLLCEKLFLQATQLIQSPAIKGKATAYSTIGNVYRERGDYTNALDYFLRSLKIGEEFVIMNSVEGKKVISKALGNIGIIYKNQGDYPKALDYYLKALKMKEELGDKKEIAGTTGNIGVVYYEQGDYAKALDFYLKALKMREELGAKNLIASALINIGNVYNNQRNYDKSLDYYFKGLKIAEEGGYAQWQANALGNIGTVYTNLKKYKEAEEYLLKALALNKKIGMLNEEVQLEKMLSDLYEKTNRYSTALEHYKKAMTLKDTLFNKEKNKELTQKEMNYEFEKKEATTKAEQEKKDAVTKIIIYSISTGFALVLLLAVFIFRGYKQKQRANIIINEQKELVEEKQKDIMDSIHYAKRIQQSLLPTEKYIQKNLRRLQNI